MNIMKRISNIRMLRLLFVGMLVIASFVGISYVGSDSLNPSRLVINTEGYNKANADAATASWWLGARGVATYVRAMTQTFNVLYAHMKAWGFIFQYNFSLVTNGPVPGTNYYVNVSLNSGDKSVQGTVDGASVAYTNVIQVRNGGSGGDIIMQFFFDDPIVSSGGDGCMLIARPYYFEASPGTIFSDTGIFEARVKKSGLDTIMYVSFNGHPWRSNPPHYVESGRVKVVDDGTNVTYNITGLAYVNVDGSDFFNQACSAFSITPPYTAGNNYYTIAYIAKHDSPYYSTALWGWDAATKSTNLCGFSNPTNLGHFNASAGFVCDGSDSTGCPDGDPYPLNSSVNALYTGMDVTASGEYYPDTIKNLSITFPAVSF